MSKELTKMLSKLEIPIAPETPYHKARQEWDDRVGNIVVQAKNWRLLAFGLVGVVAMLVFGIILTATKPKFIPYIVEVSNAEVKNISKGSAVKYVPTDAQIKHHLVKFVEKFRSVSIDREVNKKWLYEVYAFLTPQTANKFDKYFTSKQGSRYKYFTESATVVVTVNSFTLVAGNTYQLQWLEIIHDSAGRLLGKEHWVGFATIKIASPQDEVSILQNPLGIWVVNFTWSKSKEKQ